MKHLIYTAILSAAAIVITTPNSVRADSTDELRKLQSTRFAALISKDINVLERLLSPSLVYTHSNGVVETKQVFIDNIKTGKMVYHSIEEGDRSVTVDGPVGVVTGVGDFSVTIGKKDIEAKLRFTDVYVKEADGNWHELAWQSLKVEPPAPIAAPAADTAPAK